MKQPAKRKGKTMLSWGKGATKTKKLGNNSKRNWIIAAIVTVVAFGGVGTYLLTQSDASGYCVNKVFRQGSSGICVKYMQQMMNSNISGLHGQAAGKYLPGGKELAVDGNYGPKTKEAVIKFQKAYSSMAGAADGIVGRKTWNVLCYYATSSINFPFLEKNKTMVKGWNAAYWAGCPKANRLLPTP